uniref:CRAL-TRIO domain-containing protein n=1 Tax=Calcidiscus leptoporus TaxID=127549 RepID=A0A7S0NV44_9EUKA
MPLSQATLTRLSASFGDLSDFDPNKTWDGAQLQSSTRTPAPVALPPAPTAQPPSPALLPPAAAMPRASAPDVASPALEVPQAAAATQGALVAETDAVASTANVAAETVSEETVAKAGPVSELTGTPPAKPVKPPPAAFRKLIVSDLIQKHRDLLDSLRSEVQDHAHFKPDQHDDIFLLRFLLSHKLKLPKAKAACCNALRIRAELALDDAAKMVTSSSWRHWEDGVVHDTAKYMIAMYRCEQPDADLGPIWYIKLSELDFQGLMAAADLSQYRRTNILLNEWLFQRLDETTRRTGVIAKTIRVIDARGWKPSGTFQKWFKTDAKLLADFSDLYPQMLGCVLVLNVPGPLKFLWDNVLKRLLPDKVTEKVDLIDPAKKASDAAVVEKWLSLDYWPERFGGRNKSPTVFALEVDADIGRAASEAETAAFAAGGNASSAYSAYRKAAQELEEATAARV